MKTDILDITQPGSGYETSKGIGPLLRYHGATVDLRAITRARADEMAADPQVRYFRFAPVEAKEVQKAILESHPTDAAASTADAATEDAKDAAPDPATTQDKGSGRKQGKK